MVRNSGGLLVGVRYLKNAEVVVMTADDLQAHRQALLCKTCGN